MQVTIKENVPQDKIADRHMSSTDQPTNPLFHLVMNTNKVSAIYFVVVKEPPHARE